MVHRSAWAATVFWLVIAGFFGAILTRHIMDRSFEYPMFEFYGRGEKKPADHGPVVAQTKSRSGTSETVTNIYADGFRSTDAQLQGMDIDQPARKLSESLNAHIKALNEDKSRENTIMILLDFLGLISSLFSAVYEFRRTKSVATP